MLVGSCEIEKVFCFTTQRHLWNNVFVEGIIRSPLPILARQEVIVPLGGGTLASNQGAFQPANGVSTWA